MRPTAQYRIFLFLTLIFAFLTPTVNAQGNRGSSTSPALKKMGIELEFTPPTIPDFSPEANPGLEGELEELRQRCVEVFKYWEIAPDAFWYDRYDNFDQIHCNLNSQLTYSHSNTRSYLIPFRDQHPWRLEKLKECDRRRETIELEALALFPKLTAFLDKVLQNDQLTPMENRAFYGVCSRLFDISREHLSSEEFVTISESVATIKSTAFYGCPKLKSIHIPASVTQIGRNIFPGKNDSPDFTIYGNPGSEAEKYAKEHNIRFVAE
ncbi:MAG: leucine-rich repeat protein [Planctomycetia bacterium]|nr:leucine-rich repeat protein [Planctomycetia bacterium]